MCFDFFLNSRFRNAWALEVFRSCARRHKVWSTMAAATAQTNIAMRKNATSIGTVRFAAGATTASFVGIAETAFVPGDRLSFVFPATADATLADIGIAMSFVES